MVGKVSENLNFGFVVVLVILILAWLAVNYKFKNLRYSKYFWFGIIVTIMIVKKVSDFGYLNF